MPDVPARAPSAEYSEWRPAAPPNGRGEQLCFRLVRQIADGLYAAGRVEYAWIDRQGNVRRIESVG